LGFKRTTYTAAIPYLVVQFLGGACAAFLIDKQLTPEMHKKLAEKGPLGVPTPDPKNLLSCIIVETIAVMFIHLVRIMVVVDDGGHKVRLFF
jgi:glycerol uptake facilitator-like aquaporin